MAVGQFIQSRQKHRQSLQYAALTLGITGSFPEGLGMSRLGLWALALPVVDKVSMTEVANKGI